MMQSERDIRTDEPCTIDEPSFGTRLKRGFGEAIKHLSELHAQHPRLYLLWCFLLPATVMLTVHAIYGVYPFGTNSVLVLDLNGQYVYFFEALRRAVYGDASILYSFSRNLGGEFLGIYAYYLASPLSYIVCLFPKGLILEALYTMFVLKTGLCGLTFGIFIRKTIQNIRPQTLVLFSACYALSGYGMIMQHNTMWTDCMILLPLVCLGVRALICEKKFKLFVASSAVAILSNYYIGYMLCLFLALYFFYCYFSMTPTERNPRGEHLHFPRALARMGLFAGIALLISCLIVLPAYYSLQFGKTTFTNPEYKFEPHDHLKYLFDLFGMFLFNSYHTVRPEGHPIVYAGLLTLVCIPFFFLSRRFSVREKLASALIMLAMLFSFSIELVDMIWHGFQAPNWLNYRYSFMLIFLLCLVAAKAFNSFSENGPPRYSIAVSVTLMLLIALAQLFDYSYLDDYAGVYPNFALLILYAVLLFFVSCDKPRRQKIARRGLTLLVTVELFVATLLNLVHLDIDVVVSNRESYLSHARKWQHVIDEIESQDTDLFYRSEMINHLTVNDPYSLGYYGLSGSTSTLNAAAIDFLFDMGISAQSHWVQYCTASPVIDSLLGIRYVYANSGQDHRMPDLYEKIYDNGNAAVFKNPYALPLAFPVNPMLNDITFNEPQKDTQTDQKKKEDGLLTRLIMKLRSLVSSSRKQDTAEDTRTYYDNASPFARLNIMLRCMFGSEESLKIFNPVSASPTVKNMNYYPVATNHKWYVTKDKSQEASLTFQVKGTGNELYAFFPSLYLKSCHYFVYIDRGNGLEYVTGNWMLTGSTYGYINLGVVEEGETLTFKMVVYSNDGNLYLYNDVDYFYYFNEENFLETVSRLSEGALQLTHFSEDRISGTLTASEDRTSIFTTIPYDKGWQITVDGKTVETYKTLDTLLAFDVSPGEHTVSMRYMPKEYILGTKLCIIGSVSFIGLIALEFTVKTVRKKKTLGNKAEH